MVRRYTKEDEKEVIGWFHSRKIDITPDYLPKVGFLEPGIAAGFVYQVDANFCIFESFISNPNTSKSERKEALREIVTEMIKEAKQLGYKDAYGFATSPTMIEHGYEQGFKKVDICTTIVKDLR